MPEPRQLRGVGVGDGVALGPVARMGRPPALPPPHPVSDRPAELEAARAALATVAADLSVRADNATDPTTTAILEALSMIAADPTLGEQVDELIDDGTDAAHAVQQAVDEYRVLLTEAGGYLAERAADLADIRDRVIAVVLGLPIPGVPDPGHPFVLAADDLSPADTAGIDTERVLALVTERGGPTSHTAILARALGLPCVVACAGIMDVADGTVVGVDAGRGVVVVDPDPALEEDLRTRVAAIAASTRAATGPGRTADGHPIALLHNIGSAGDLEGVVDDDFEGVGLFRTEFLFLDRPDAPGFDEQRAAYAAALRAADGRKVVVRTLDAGADKPLRFIPFPDEPNPALGVRGLRVARRHPTILADQLAAIAAAASDVPDSEVWVMAPMVATPTEASDFAASARAVGLDRIGVMIEIPSAALRAQEILAVVDFLSIGTNDLGQYTFAADRMEGDLYELLDPWQPALLELIGRCAEAGRRLDKPVGICGEAAADAALSPVLVGLGITSLSMAGRATAAVRRALAGVTLADCERAAKLALAADSPESAKAAVGEHATGR